jgi:hypothetical protein
MQDDGLALHRYFGVGPPLSGPGPVTRRPGRLLVGDLPEAELPTFLKKVEAQVNGQGEKSKAFRQ